MERQEELPGPSQTPSSSTAAGTSRQRSNKACRTCAEAKLKCVYSSTEEGAKCDRCARLKKTCNSQVPKPRKRRQPDKARVTQLEKRLDTVLKLLSGQEGRQSDASAAELNLPFGSSREGESSHSLPSHRQSVTDHEDSSGAGPYSTPISQGQSSTDDGYAETEEEFLRLYRRKISPAFPFVVIPEHVTVEDMHASKPFLFEVISVIGNLSPPAAVQQASGKRLLDHLCYRMFQNGEKSLDVLQGLLLMIGWNNKLYFRKAQMTNLIQLALALIVDLGLNIAPNQYDRQKMATFAPSYFSHGDNPLPDSRTSEERRTLLGYFYMASVVATSHKRLELPPYSKHMQECRDFLQNAREFPSDVRLVQLVKIQNFTQRVTHTLKVDKEFTNQSNRAISVCIEAFASELANMRENIPHSLRHDPLLSMHYDAAGIHLYEVGVSMPYSDHEYEENTLSRQEVLLRCVKPIQGYLDTFCNTPASNFFYQPVVMWIMMASASVVLSKLIFFKGADWDVRSVRQHDDLPSMLFRFIDRCLTVSEELKNRRMRPGSATSEVRFWDDQSSKINWIKAFYQMKLSSGSNDDTDGEMPKEIRDPEDDSEHAVAHDEVPQPMSTGNTPGHEQMSMPMHMAAMMGEAGGGMPMAGLQGLQGLQGQGFQGLQGLQGLQQMPFLDESFFHQMAWDPGFHSQFPTGMDMGM